MDVETLRLFCQPAVRGIPTIKGLRMNDAKRKAYAKARPSPMTARSKQGGIAAHYQRRGVSAETMKAEQRKRTDQHKKWGKPKTLTMMWKPKENGRIYLAAPTRYGQADVLKGMDGDYTQYRNAWRFPPEREPEIRAYVFNRFFERHPRPLPKEPGGKTPTPKAWRKDNFPAQAGIYLIRSAAGPVYVGMSNNLRRRVYEHLKNMRSGRKNKLYNAMRKHGLDYDHGGFCFEILETPHPDNLSCREDVWIHALDANASLNTNEFFKPAHFKKKRKQPCM